MNFAKNKIVSTAQSQVGLPVNIGSLEGNLFYNLKVQDIKIGDLAEIKSINVSYNILSIISRKIEINSLIIDRISLDLDKAKAFARNVTPKKTEEKERRMPLEITIKKMEINNTNIASIINERNIRLLLNIRGALIDQTFAIEQLDIKTEKSYVIIRGNVPLTEENSFNLKYSLFLTVDEIGIGRLKGTVQSTGNIEGKFSNPVISNNTEVSIDYRKEQIRGRFQINWKMPFLDSLDINANFSVRMPDQKLELTLKKKFTNFFAGVISTYGDIRIPGSISGSFEDPRFKSQIQGALKFAGFKPKINGAMTYHGNTLNLNINLSEKNFSARLNGILDILNSKIIKGDIVIRCPEINLVNNFLKEPMPVSGALNMRAEFDGSLDNPYISSKLTLHNATIYNETINKADLKFSLQNEFLYLENGLIQSPRGQINISGNYGTKNSSFNCRISSENIRFESPEVFGNDTIPLSGNIGLDINLYGNISDINGSGKFYLANVFYDKYKFDDQNLEFEIKHNIANICLSDISEHLRLNASIQLEEPYHFDALLSLKHFEFARYLGLESGYICGNISASGDIASPILSEANITVDTISAIAEKNEIHNSEPIYIEIQNGIVRIHKASITVQDHILLVQGQVPLDKRFGDVNLKIQGDHIQIGSLYAIFSKHQAPGGFLDVAIEVKGDLTTPKISGQINFEKVSYALPDILVDSVSGLIKFQKDYFNIEYIKGKINDGTFDITGFIKLDKSGIDTIAINLVITKIDYASKEFGSVILSSSVWFIAKKDSYKINGELTIDQGIYDRPFNLQTITQILTTANRPKEENKLLKQIYCNIGINSPNGIKISNNIANITVDPDLQIKGLLSRINIYGTVKTSSPGEVKYLGKRFDIMRAIIQFDNPHQIDPVLDLEAMHSVSSVDGDYEMTMALTGTIGKWYLKLSSDPPIPEQDIISLLLINRRRPGLYLYTEAKDINLTGLAKDYALGLARGTLERTAEKSLGFEKFTITGDLLEPRQWDIGFEKRINKKLTFIYGTGIESWEVRRIGINYAINDNLSIFTLHDQENMNSSVDFDLNLKVK